MGVRTEFGSMRQQQVFIWPIKSILTTVSLPCAEFHKKSHTAVQVHELAESPFVYLLASLVVCESLIL